MNSNKLMAMLLERMLIEADVCIIGWGGPCIQYKLDKFKDDTLSEDEADDLIRDAVRAFKDEIIRQAVEEVRE